MMRDLDKLTWISLAEHEPERALVWHAHTLLHARCAEAWAARMSQYGPSFARVAISAPMDNDIATWGNGCAHCGRIVVTTDSKPF